MPHDFNAAIIDEFRANEGKVGGGFDGAPMVLVHSTGAKSGEERINPLVYQPLDGGAIAVFGSAAGRPKHPAWIHNLRANPETTIEVGTEVRAVRAREAEGAERDAIWSKQKELMPGFADYESSAGDRTIPVVVLEPR